MLVAALVLAPVAVKFIPHLRHSPAFDKLLLFSSALLAFLGAWLALGLARANGESGAQSAFKIAEVPVLPVLLGAIVGAVLLGALLFMLDLFTPTSDELDEIDKPSDEAQIPADASNHNTS